MEKVQILFPAVQRHALFAICRFRDTRTKSWFWQVQTFCWLPQPQPCPFPTSPGLSSSSTPHSEQIEGLMKASHLPPRADNPHPDSFLLPPTPTSLYNYQLSPATPDLPPPLPPPHVNLSASQQESWNRLNSNSNAHKVYHSPPVPSNSYRIEKSHFPDFRLPPPSPVRTGQAPSRGQTQQGWEQQYGLYTPLTTQQHNGHRQSAPSNYFPRQQYEVRGSLPSERYDRRSLVMPGDRQPQIPKTRSQPYIAPQYDRYQKDPQRTSLPNPPRSYPVASVPELKHSEAPYMKRK
jgi:hypothetical protein